MAIMVNGRPNNNPWVVVIFGGVFVLAGLVPVALALFTGAPGFLLLFGAVFVGVGGLVMARGVMQLVARSSFNEARISSEHARWRLGERATLSLQLDPKRELTLLGGSVRLVTTEYAHYSAGSRSRTYTDTLHEHTERIDLPQTLSSRLDRKIVLDIPRTIPPSWGGRNNRFVTSVEVKVEIDRWPDLTLEQQLDIAAEEA